MTTSARVRAPRAHDPKGAGQWQEAELETGVRSRIRPGGGGDDGHLESILQPPSFGVLGV